MKPNLSNLDRTIRVIVAALFAYLYFGGIVTGALGIVLAVLAVVFVLTAYGLKTSIEENRKGYPGFPTIYEQKSKLTILEIWSVILNRSIWFR